MRFKSVITLLLFAFIFVLADIQRPGSYINPRMPQSDTTVVDNSSMGQQKKGILNPDSTTLDSLQLAILKHNRAIDDSIRLDSLNKTKSKGINAPINYTAEDSLIYNAQDKTAHLFGSSTVKYEAMDLKSEKIFLNMDSSVVHATGAIKDTVSKKLVGTPEFNMGKDAYKSDTMAYNFKTKKGLINQVFTQQQEGFLRSELSKRDS